MVPIEPILEWITQYGHLGLFLLLMLGVLGLPVPDETLMTFAGYLIFTGTFAPAPTYVVCFFGAASGITLSYLIGRALGAKLLPRYGTPPERVARVQAWFGRLGRWALTVGYFVPGLRHFTAIVAGMSRLRMAVFCPFAYLGAVIWSATFITAGYFIGDGWYRASEQARHWIIGAALAAGAVGGIALLVRWVLRRRGRQSS